MPKVIYNTATTFNGYIADESHSLSWLFEVDQTEMPDHGDFLKDIDVLVSGSSTYEWVVREENLLAEPQKWPSYYGNRPMFVFTNRELPRPENVDVRFVSGSVAKALPAIQAATTSGDIWLVGGGDLAGQFLDANALDEIRLSVTPVALTGGAPLLPRRVLSDQLELRSVEKVGQFAQLTYTVRHLTDKI